MRPGIQAKLITTLVLAGLLPLVLSLAVVLVTTVQIQTNSVGQSFRTVAHQGASQLSTMLSAQVEFVWLLSHLPGTVDFLNRANTVPPLTPEEIEEIERRWPELPEDDPLIRPILHNPLAARWNTVHSYQRRFAEVLVTDATGRLVAATNKASDFYQGDEQWWKECYAGGNGRIFLADITWDESAISMHGTTGAVVATLCVPIHSDAPQDSGKVVGIMKIALDAGWLVQHLARLNGPGYAETQMWLAQASGEAIPDGVSPPPARLPGTLMKHIRLYSAGWTRDSGVEGQELLGFAAVEMPRGNVETDDVEWYVVVAAPKKAAVGPIYRLAGTIASAGIGVIVLCFAAGLLIARREIVGPLMALSRGVDELERGHIDYRLPAPAPGEKNATFRDDEIGELAREFNRMAEELGKNVERLRQADEMKQRFIDLASHELRTPVTYVLGVSELAQRQADGDPRPVLEKIAAKARRLNHIVDNMFKLLGTGSFHSELVRSEVDLKEMVHAVCRELDPFLAERHQRWNLRMPESLPTISADAEKIRDVLVNLLSNAMRFSRDGQSVDVTIRQAPQHVEITVTDQGAGIDPADLPRIFEPFFTGNAGDLMRHRSGEYAHMTRGIGLGLSVVKRFVEMHGGTVSVASSPGTGTQFTVRLPAAPAAA